ncbi:outer membrane beta-barrel protein [Riemerella anatipestifer]|uniref:Outer membrane beta-barrel protein n=1 Tax=Riemerella anatipestifer TaxID=34085 RepID=A0AAP6HF47_RIEAN|nr:outer membrane beta-barrel protein [Riemerella anatipestifer]MBT0549623.1 outer membrane beta-barrel protein [Riemerella anatipestifer]MBT0550767.1 outer membrane beta-barrel protein [Riemerella anatipestifer]MBT0553529.1 outer membrane beta-barrel protein [Riemerella anatipestifer]MBT0556533.1 outer membrane beta-barrel protein [Riemerella anatipestifer]MBT0560349.1 outer membrane beta-barrel protein [Riemerella anatipestifer]
MRLLIILLFSCTLNAQISEQNRNLVAGVSLSNISVNFDDATSLKLISGRKLGYFIGFTKNYNISDKYFLDARIKFSETGGTVKNSTYFIKTKFPNDLEKYRNALLKIAVYQIAIETNIGIQTNRVRIYGGLQPSLIIFGRYKENYLKSIEGKPSEEGKDIKTNEIKNNINLFNIKAQTGITVNVSKNYFIDMSYHFGLHKITSINAFNNSLNFNQSIIQIGGGVYF